MSLNGNVGIKREFSQTMVGNGFTHSEHLEDDREKKALLGYISEDIRKLNDLKLSVVEARNRLGFLNVKTARYNSFCPKKQGAERITAIPDVEQAVLEVDGEKLTLHLQHYIKSGRLEVSGSPTVLWIKILRAVDPRELPSEDDEE